MNIAMILAGGVGSRVGADRPKQFVEILGRPVLAYTIDIYQKNPQVDRILVVCHDDWVTYVKEMIEDYKLDKACWITNGGSTFQKSVINGIDFLRDKVAEDDIVMIHYGAAPFTEQKVLLDNIEKCKKYNMAASCIPCFQLMGSNDHNDRSIQWKNRDEYIQIACPQSFKFWYIKDIYRRGKAQGILDSVDPHITSLMYALGDTVYQSYGNQSNIKITTKEDFFLFEGYVLACRRNGRFL